MLSITRRDDSSDEETSFPSWADQVPNFPSRTAQAEKVQAWLGLFLEQRTFSELEVDEFVQEVRLDGEDLHTLGKDELRDCLPKNQDEYGDGSPYRFEQMRRHLLADIIRARKQNGIKITEVKKSSITDKMQNMPVMALSGAMLGVLVPCFVVCIMSWVLADENY
ncbi:hypothetical protein PG994_009002 [Apiospora phragmitis]|uniref:Uncharacterized protein n=1 Tax=Apiospora phragmitis TaxID=2905665 RepID=A0ABR1UI27_9PEZI